MTRTSVSTNKVKAKRAAQKPKIREALANVNQSLEDFEKANFELGVLVYEAGSQDLESFQATMKEIFSAGNPGYNEKSAKFLFHSVENSKEKKGAG